MAATLATCPTCSRQVSTAAPSCPHCGQPLWSQPRKTERQTAQIAMVVAVLAFAFIVASVIGRGCEGCEKVSRRSQLNATASLTEPERTSCDAYATAAENFARGREAGVSLEDHLTAAAVACRNNPTSISACKGLPKLATVVHAEKWTAADAAGKIKADCRHYIWP